jgi:hypothetical protein
MLRSFKAYTFLLCFICSCTVSIGQTEFPKEFIAHIRLHSGMITYPGNAPELFVGGLQLIPQVTLVPYKLRGGVVAGAFYSYNKINGAFGPTISYKITEFKGGHFGSLGNLHINLDHLWGTDKQHLAGGGINLDLLNKLVVSLSAHRDYKLSNWWIQSAIAFRISKVKQPKETFPK